MSKQKKLCLGIDNGALPGFGNPGPSDFHSAVRGLYIPESCTADDHATVAMNDGKRDCPSALPLFQRFSNELKHPVTTPNFHWHPYPNIGIEPNFTKRVQMADREWLQPDGAAFDQQRSSRKLNQIFRWLTISCPGFKQTPSSTKSSSA